MGRAGEAPYGSRHASGGARAAAARRRRLSGRGPTGRGARRRLPPWSPRVWCGAASGGLRRRPRRGARGPRAPPVPVTRRGRGAGARRPPFAGEAFVQRGAAARRAWAALPLLPGRGWACARLAALGARCSFPRRNVVFVAGSSATARCRIRQVRSHSWVDLYLSSPCGLFLPSSCQSHVTVNVQWDLSRISPSTEITQTWPKACCGPASLSQASRADGTASDPGPRKTGGLGAVVPERLTLGPSLASSPVTVAVSRTVGF